MFRAAAFPLLALQGTVALVLNAVNSLEIILNACTCAQAPRDMPVRYPQHTKDAGKTVRKADGKIARHRLCNKTKKADINVIAASSRVAQELTVKTC